jgi:hypothetical protein
MPEDQNMPKHVQTEESTLDITLSDSTILPSETQSTNMEVHHHPDLHHRRKHWKEYFLEFLMIFLAVCLGFITENIREHISEHRNARILAQSMLEDLKKDTASLHTGVLFSGMKLKSVDILISILHTPHAEWNDTIFYNNISPLFVAVPFNTTDGTYDQMKTSGTLRYFNQSHVNLMNAYAVQFKKTTLRDEAEDKGTWLLAPYIFDNINLEVMYDIRFNKPITHEMYIKFTDKAVVDKFINMVMMIKTFRTRSLQEYKEQLMIADKLIEALKKEYHLE